MPSTIPSVRTLAALMLQHGVTRVVICPGSRNSPIAATLSSMPEMECRGATDERSAGFASLGWIAQCGQPVAVCVTSGSALLNLHPAVAEASYRHLPLLIISADRPAAWIGQQDGQTLPQPGVFGSLCRMSAQVPEAEEDAWHRNRTINEALLELRHRVEGPVHVNLPLSEPLHGGNSAPLPMERVIRRTRMAAMDAAEKQGLEDTLNSMPRRLILLGQLPHDAALPLDLLTEKHFAAAGECLCNTPGVCQRPDLLIGPDLTDAAELSPDLLITCGGCLVSKRLKRLLRDRPPKEHWHISPDGAVIDTFRCLTRCLEGEAAEAWGLLASLAKKGDASYAARWQAPLPSPIFPYSGMKLVGDLMSNIPAPAVLHLANSSSIRYAQLFPLPQGVQAECNRGVNGIEGSVSAAIGYAIGDERLQFLICGDLSFFYDMNALWLQGYGPNVRILLLHNGGGGIFHTLPMPPNPYIEARHHASAGTWAESCGFACHKVSSADDWPPALAALTGESDRPVLVEAATDSATDAALMAHFYNCN